MSEKTVTLEDFIENYKKKAPKPKSYSEWLGEQGGMPDFSASEEKAQREFDRERASYGKRGDALSRRGLVGSGYAAYLDANAYSELQNTKRDIEKNRNLYESESKKGYADYLSKEKEAGESRLSKAINNIIHYGAGNKEGAYIMALAAGLDPDTANIVADAGSSIVEYGRGIESESGKENVVYNALKLGFRGEQAVAYAMACGMNESDAKKVGKALDEIFGNSLYSFFQSAMKD
jgi:hypothetical protein